MHKGPGNFCISEYLYIPINIFNGKLPNTSYYMESASSWPREPGSAADSGCVGAAAPHSCNRFRNPLTHLPSCSRICTEISVLPVSLKNTFASLLGSESSRGKCLPTSSAQVFAGARLQLENPSVVNASPARSSQGSCSSHVWQCYGIARAGPQLAAGTGDEHLPLAVPCPERAPTRSWPAPRLLSCAVPSAGSSSSFFQGCRDTARTRRALKRGKAVLRVVCPTEVSGCGTGLAGPWLPPGDQGCHRTLRCGAALLLWGRAPRERQE